MKTKLETENRGRRILFCLTVALAMMAVNALAARSQTAAHRHPQAGESEIPKIEIIRTRPVKNARREEFTRSREFEAFSVYGKDAGYRIFFVERRTGKTYEIRGVGLPWRPFTDLVWTNDRTLVFDCRANPHHGAHYEFDAKAKKLNGVLIFRDPADGN